MRARYLLTDVFQAFSRGYFRLSLLGVPNLNDLTDCTKVMPKRI
jgi:hypothetical protein